MIVALLLALPAVWITWVLFREDESADKAGRGGSTPAADPRDRTRTADEE